MTNPPQGQKTKHINFFSGFATLIGKPNVGKSTLINALVGSKVSIVSQKPQTTRHRILGVKSDDNYQIVFVDTPGIHKPSSELGRFMEKSYQDEIKETDIVLYIADITLPPTEYDLRAQQLLKTVVKAGIPVILLINKIDLITEDRIEKNRGKYQELYDFHSVYELSALKGTGLNELVAGLKKLLPPGPPYFPSNMHTDQSPELLAAEVVREKVLMRTRQEVPHGVFVYTEQVRQGVNERDLYFSVVIYVERDNHKGILIGKSGSRLKEIGSLARQELEQMLNKRIYLDLWVKVKEAWKDRRDLLKSWGYEI